MTTHQPKYYPIPGDNVKVMAGTGAAGIVAGIDLTAAPQFSVYVRLTDDKTISAQTADLKLIKCGTDPARKLATEAASLRQAMLTAKGTYNTKKMRARLEFLEYLLSFLARHIGGNAA